jgi:GMP synthase (glutamine-hydrolysing)
MIDVLAISHVAFEDLGTLGDELEARGARIERLDAPTSDLERIDPLAADLAVMLGGPIGVYEQDTYPFLRREIEIVRARLQAGRPTIGICLGAQIMAAAAGAAVYPGGNGKEIGWSSLVTGNDAEAFPPLLKLIASGTKVLHWHGDTFDLPPGAAHLAATDQYPNQAFLLGRNALALQFHPEVTAFGLESWYVGHSCELFHAGIDVRSLRQAGQDAANSLAGAVGPFWKECVDRLLEGS